MSDSERELKKLIVDLCHLSGRTIEIAENRPVPAEWRDAVRGAGAHVELALEALAPSATLLEPYEEQLEEIAERLLDAPPANANAHLDPGRNPSAAAGSHLNGTVAVLPLPVVLGALAAQTRSGVLEVQLGSDCAHLQLECGRPIAAYGDSTPEGWRLGDLLVSQGALQKWQIESFLADCSLTRVDPGQALQVGGLVPRETLRASLLVHLRGLFERMLSAPNATYAFRDGAQPTPGDGNCGILGHMLRENAGRDDWADTQIPPALPNEEAPPLPVPAEEESRVADGGWLLGDEGGDEGGSWLDGLDSGPELG